MLLRRWFGAFTSIILLLLTVYLSFNAYYGRSDTESPLLNVKFKYWILDSSTNLTKPYFWDVNVIEGPGDNASIRKGFAGGRNALELQVYQDGKGDEYIWATIHLRQDLAGERAEKLFLSNVGIWVYPTFSYLCDEKTKNPANAFGVEVNDGIHILWFIFSDRNVGVYTLNNHRIVVIQTPLNIWSYRKMNISAEYIKAGWRKPNSISFILMLGLTQAMPGKRVGFFKEIDVECPPTPLRIDNQLSFIREPWGPTFSLINIFTMEAIMRMPAIRLEAAPKIK